MKGPTLSALTGLLLCCMGVVTMLGWYLNTPMLFTLPIDDTFTKFNSAAGLFLAGFGIWLMNFSLNNKMVDTLIVILGGLLIAVSTVELIPNFSSSMPNILSMIFLLTGLSFILSPLIHKKWVFLSLGSLAAIIGIIGLSSLITHSVSSWASYVFMPLLTTFGVVALSISLLATWKGRFYNELSMPVREDRGILILNSGIVVCFLLLTILITIPLLNYRPETLRELTERGFLVSLLTIVFGMFLLYWQVMPIIRKIMNSKKELFIANQRLQESENRFRSAFDFAAVGMALISLSGKCIKVNQSLCEMLGLSEQELLNNDLRIFRHPDDSKQDALSIQQMLETNLKILQSEQRFFHKNGDVIWVIVSTSLVSSAEGQPLYFIYQCQNITAEKKAEEKLKQMAYHDPLTGLANRNKLEQDMHHLIKSSQRTRPGFALIFLDLDHFKNINDTIGHDAGDVLLQVVSERLKNTVRSTDMVARLGGDEFVLVVTNVKKVEAVIVVAQKILTNLLKPILIKGHEIYVTTSIGISFFPYDGNDIETLMKNADMALYRAKEQGRNNYQFCTPEMTIKAQEKMVRQNALNHAMLKDEFYLFYQPKMDLATQRICGVEALLRWKNNECGPITTEEIISLAEESGLIISLSEWIFRTACKQIKTWHNLGLKPLTVAINLSTRQFKQADFVKSILNILTETQLSADNIELEITESLIMQDPENTLKILQQLKQANIQLAIDDFGTGYSSLSYLKRFSVDKIKIDKTFIHKFSDENNLAIVTAMIAMAHKLGIRTLAEGVETQQQYELLLQEHCSEVQGYYLSPPLSAEEMTEFLSENIDKVTFLAGTDREGTRS